MKEERTRPVFSAWISYTPLSLGIEKGIFINGTEAIPKLASVDAHEERE